MSLTDRDTPPDVVGRMGPGVMAFTLLFAATMTIMAGATIAPSLPAMVAHFGEDRALAVRLLLTITALAIALAAPIAGWLGDRLGRIGVLYVSVAIYVLSGAAGLMLNDLSTLLVSRVMLGIAVAGVMTSVGGLIGDIYDSGARDRMLGLQGAAMGFGGVIFLGLGGLLAGLGWRGPFAIYLFPIVLLVLIPFALPRGMGGTIPDRRSTSEPRQVPKASIAVLCLAAFLGMVGFYAVPVQLPFLLAERGSDNPAVAGGLMAGLTLVSAVVGLFYGRLAADVSVPKLGLAAFAFLSFGLILISFGSRSTWVGLILIGLGMGLFMPTLSRWLLGLAPPEVRGRTMGALTTAIFAGQFASPLVLATAIAAGGLPGSFLLAAVVSSAGCFLVSWAARLAAPNRDQTDPNNPRAQL